MTNPQGYEAVPIKWTPSVPVDTKVETGVQSVEAMARIHIPPMLAEVWRIMRDIRATGKCGMFVVRWDGQAWCFHVCDPPARINEA